jgi:hypothetical protein
MFADVISPDIYTNMLRPDVMPFLLILTIVIGILLRFYTAMVLSGYQPATVQKKQVQGQ